MIWEKTWSFLLSRAEIRRRKTSMRSIFWLELCFICGSSGLSSVCNSSGIVGRFEKVEEGRNKTWIHCSRQAGGEPEPGAQRLPDGQPPNPNPNVTCQSSLLLWDWRWALQSEIGSWPSQPTKMWECEGGFRMWDFELQQWGNGFAPMWKCCENAFSFSISWRPKSELWKAGQIWDANMRKSVQQLSFQKGVFWRQLLMTFIDLNQPNYYHVNELCVAGTPQNNLIWSNKTQMYFSICAYILTSK